MSWRSQAWKLRKKRKPSSNTENIVTGYRVKNRLELNRPTPDHSREALGEERRYGTPLITAFKIQIAQTEAGIEEVGRTLS